MPKSILIRRAQSGGWCGYISPSPKMPNPDSIREWKDFEGMVKTLKTLPMKVIVYNDDLIAQLAKHGIAATRPGTAKK